MTVNSNTIDEWKLDADYKSGDKKSDGVNEDAAKEGNLDLITPIENDMTAANADLVDPRGWKLLMPSHDNVLCLVKWKEGVVVMNADIDVHDVTNLSQLMMLIKAMIEVRRVKGTLSSSKNFLYVLQLVFRIRELFLKFPNSFSNPPKTVIELKILTIFSTILVSIFPKFPLFWCQCFQILPQKWCQHFQNYHNFDVNMSFLS